MYLEYNCRDYDVIVTVPYASLFLPFTERAYEMSLKNIMKVSRYIILGTARAIFKLIFLAMFKVLNAPQKNRRGVGAL